MLEERHFMAKEKKIKELEKIEINIDDFETEEELQEFLDKQLREFIISYIPQAEEDEIVNAFIAQRQLYYLVKAIDLVLSNGLIPQFCKDEMKQNVDYLNGLADGFKIFANMAVDPLGVEIYVEQTEHPESHEE